MNICPACKEGIEDDSYFCDQCGQELSFCKQCGHVGLGRRCTRCGGLMVSRHEKAVERQPMASVNVNVANVYAAQRVSAAPSVSVAPGVAAAPGASAGPSVAAGPSASAGPSVAPRPSISIAQAGPSHSSLPALTLANDSLNIRIVAMNGAIIGRRKGPYVQFFEQHSYVSGVHAQLKYKPGSGWCVIDKNSSNGTRVNQRPLEPEVEMTLSNGDILTIANINLQVIIR